jgi:hypothetical protein
MRPRTKTALVTGGGFILATGAAIYDAREQNVEAMLRAAHDCGGYRWRRLGLRAAFRGP